MDEKQVTQLEKESLLSEILEKLRSETPKRTRDTFARSELTEILEIFERSKAQALIEANDSVTKEDKSICEHIAETFGVCEHRLQSLLESRCQRRPSFFKVTYKVFGEPGIYFNCSQSPSSD